MYIQRLKTLCVYTFISFYKVYEGEWAEGTAKCGQLKDAMPSFEGPGAEVVEPFEIPVLELVKPDEILRYQKNNV